jgi:hypothetical protein
VTDLKLILKKQLGFQRAHFNVHQLGREIGDIGEAIKRKTTAPLLLDSEKALPSYG